MVGRVGFGPVFLWSTALACAAPVLVPLGAIKRVYRSHPDSVKASPDGNRAASALMVRGPPVMVSTPELGDAGTASWPPWAGRQTPP